MQEIEWRVVAEIPRMEVALALRARLREAGIDLILSPEIGHPDMLPAAPLSEPYKLMVPRADEGRARVLLEDLALQESPEHDETAEEGNGV